MWPSVSSPSMPPVSQQTCALAVVVFEVLLDLGCVDSVRVAVLVQQAVGGGEHGAAAVEVDGAALHDDAGMEDRLHAEQLRHARRHGVVIVVRRILPAPRVEAPVDDGQAASRLPHQERRPVIAAPAFVGLHVVERDALQVHARALQLAFDDELPVLVGHIDVHFLAQRDDTHDFAELIADAVVSARKTDAFRPRPGKHRAALRLPLGGEGVAEFTRGLDRFAVGVVRFGHGTRQSLANLLGERQAGPSTSAASTASTATPTAATGAAT